MRSGFGVRFAINSACFEAGLIKWFWRLDVGGRNIDNTSEFLALKLCLNLGPRLLATDVRSTRLKAAYHAACAEDQADFKTVKKNS